MRSSRVIIAGIISALLTWPGCTPYHQPKKAFPILDPGKRIEFQGFTTLPPQDEGWSFTVKTMLMAMMGKAQDALHTQIASVNLVFLDKEISTSQALEEYVLRTLGKAEGRLTIDAVNTAVQDLGGALCVRSDAKGIDRGVAGHEGRSFRMDIFNMDCIHPDNGRMLVSLSYSRRTPSSYKATPVGDKARAFLHSLSFTPLKKPFVDAIVSVGEKPQIITCGHGSVWVPSIEENTLFRISPRLGTIVAKIPVGKNPVMAAHTEEAVWVTNKGDGTVSRVNIDSNEVEATIEVGSVPLGITAGSGSLWVANSGSNTLSRINPSNNAVEAVIPVGKKPSDVDFAEDHVWILNHGDGTVSRIDPRSGNLSGEAIDVGDSSGFLEVCEGALWTTDPSKGTVQRHDLRDLSRVERIQVSSLATSAVCGGGWVWIAHPKTNLVSRLHQQSRLPVGVPIPVGMGPITLSHCMGYVWVSNWTEGSIHRIDYRQ